MKTLASNVSAWTCAALCAFTAFDSTSWAAVPGQTALGTASLSGGASYEDLVDMHRQRRKFNLWVVTAALKSGAHMADVKVTVRDAQQRIVFDNTLEGPWLFLQLPRGRYEVQAQWADETLRQATTIHPGDHHQTFFYFNVPDHVSPDNRKPFATNPYGEPGQ